MLDPLTATDIQIVRLQLQLICSRQTDPAVRYYGAIVDFNLAQALVRDNPIQRAELASYVEELRVALCRAGRQVTDNTERAGADKLPGERLTRQLR
jgi:hypothetical protein